MFELKEVLPILFERSSAAQTFWNFEIVVSLGILTVLATAPSFAQSLRVRIVFIVAFLMFAAVNLNSLVWVTEQRIVLAEQVQQLLPADGPSPGSRISTRRIQSMRRWTLLTSHPSGSCISWRMPRSSSSWHSGRT